MTAPLSFSAVTLRTGCKVNLFLRIGLPRADGYHDLETLFLPLDEPHDLLTIREEHGRSGLTVHCAAPEINPENNTLTKAYTLFAKHTGFAPDLSVQLEKGVPHGSGLGGGSANAAGLLAFLRKLAISRRIPDPGVALMHHLAAATGADVPFFLEPAPAFASGIGDTLVRTVNPYSGKTIVLACPDIVVSTAWAYQALDNARQKKEIGAAKNLTSAPGEGTTRLAHGVVPENDFEAVVFEAFPLLLQLRNAFLENGAQVALLSGSGSAVFGIFDDRIPAEKVAQKVTENTWAISEKHIRTYIQVMR